MPTHWTGLHPCYVCEAWPCQMRGTLVFISLLPRSRVGGSGTTSPISQVQVLKEVMMTLKKTETAMSTVDDLPDKNLFLLRKHRII